MREGIPLKRVARLQYGDALPSEQRVDGPVPVAGSGGISGSHVIANVRAPGIIVGRKGSYGAIHWMPEGCFAIDTAYFIDGRSTSADLRWLFYALQAVDLRGVSQDVGVPGLSREAAHEVLLPRVPSREEQLRISGFLDAEIGRLDFIVQSRKRQLYILEKRRSAALAGIFKAPASSLPTRLKYLMCNKPRYGVLVPEFVDDGVPFIRVNDLLDLEGRSDSLVRIPESLSQQYARTRVQVNDILLSVVGTLGRAALAPAELEGANVARAVASLRVRRDVDPGLFVRWIETADFMRQALDATGSDTAQPTLGMEDLANFKLRWPTDVHEQQRLAREVEEVAKYHDELAACYERQTGLLAERRRALITAAVTGQIDVTTARGVRVP